MTRTTLPALAGLLLLAASGCVASRTVRLELGPPREDVLGRVALEDARPAADREFRAGDDEEGRCTRWYGDRFIEPSKTEYLRRLVAEGVAPAGSLVLKIDRFDTIERCESERKQAKRSAMFGGGLLGALVASAVSSGPKRGDDDFEVRLEGTANGAPFRFSRAFDHGDLGSAAPDAPEYRARIEAVFGAFAAELKRSAGVAGPTATPTATARPAPIPIPTSTPTSTATATASARPAPASRPTPTPAPRPTPPAPATATAGLYQQQCDDGSAEACAALGALHDAGREVPRDLARAKDLYRRGCEGGVARACTNLGAVIEGERRDYPAAAALYRRACDAGNGTGCLNLGRLSAAGRGVKKDPAAAATLYQTSCDRGQPKGCTLLARLHEAGAGVDQDPDRAAALYDLACQRGDAAACEAARAGTPRSRGRRDW